MKIEGIEGIEKLMNFNVNVYSDFECSYWDIPVALS